MNNRLIQIILFSLFTSLKVFCQSETPTEKLIEKLEHYIEKNNIPGVSISIVQSDSIIFTGGIGFADIEKKEKVTEKHLFRQGSISKSFTALGLFKLLQDTPYNLDSNINSIDNTLPYSNKWEATNPVKISHLLEHTSGFEDFHLHAMYNSRDSIMPPVIEMVKDHRKSLNVRWQPGSRKAYSNPNYIVAGHLIEVISGQTYNTYINDNILKPIGMSSSGFYFKKPKNKVFASGYQRIGSSLNPISFATINGASAGDFCANAEDMALFLKFMLSRNTTLFSKKQFDRIEIPKTSVAAKNGLKFGYGLGNYSIWKNGYLFHGHNGQIDGFTSRYLYSRDADLGIAISMNRNGNDRELVDKILNHLLASEKKPKSYKRVTRVIPESLKEKFAGFYEFKSSKSKLLSFTDRMLAGLTLDFRKDKIITRTLLGKPKDTLHYTGNNKFYMNNETVPSAMLIESNLNKNVLWINDNYTEKESRTKRLCIFFALLISTLILSSFFIYSIFWLVKRVFKRERKPLSSHLVIFGYVIFVILTFLGFGLSVENIKTLPSKNVYSFLMYLSSFTVVILSFISVWRCFKLTQKKPFRIYYILTSIATIIISVYLINIGFIGLKLWSY
ncbi:serine hydrolase domain-containing protein [Winogradskyella flava]|uniref:serine hydrolase domain-containing protein n=1 Tax=Winogradskyella flava TaxID=1884876 RepID=UPI00248F9E61|nr:serine hydrolase domain-containing protein [Winogradskyella flava]